MLHKSKKMLGVIDLHKNLLIAKSYRPTLFRQGPPAGPHYLLEVMHGELTRQQAVIKWDAEEKQLEKKSTSFCFFVTSHTSESMCIPKLRYFQ